GFKGVADEIHGLAQRTRTATQEIAGLIASVQREAQESVVVAALEAESVLEGRQLAEKALQGLRRIADGAEQTSARMSQVAQAVEEQARAVHTVASGSNRIGQMLDIITRATGEQSQASVFLESAARRVRAV